MIKLHTLYGHLCAHSCSRSYEARCGRPGMHVFNAICHMPSIGHGCMSWVWCSCHWPEVAQQGYAPNFEERKWLLSLLASEQLPTKHYAWPGLTLYKIRAST